MQINPRLYPHPVLSWFSDDYPRRIFQPAINVSGNRGFFRISMTCKTSSRSIRELIQGKKAAYAVHVECSSTRYRTVFTSCEDEFEVDIPVGDLEGKVQVCRLIICTQPIKNFSSEEFHEDFAGRSFDLTPGDVIAVAESIEFPADKQEDELARIPSIFSIKKSLADNPPPLLVSISDQKIGIYLAPEVHTKFLYLNTDHNIRSTLASAVLIPALIFTLERVANSEDPGEFMDYRWYRVLARRLADINVDIADLRNAADDTVVLANRLVGDPLSNAFTDLESVLFEQGE